MPIPLGSKVCDRITGFSGIATSRVEYLTGCTQYGVVPAMQADGKFPDAVWLDEGRLDVLVLHAVTVQPAAPNGGPSIAIRSSNQPPRV